MTKSLKNVKNEKCTDPPTLLPCPKPGFFMLVLREYDGSLREYIDSHDIDAVIVAYASFMIGAHDYESSANYAMFDFY